MSRLLYPRLIVIWIAVGFVLLDSALIYEALNSPFETMYIFLGWLILGLNLVFIAMLAKLWNTDLDLMS